MTERAKAATVLTMNTLAFAACFAVWMLNSVLATWLSDNGVIRFDKTQLGWLLGIPVLTGSVLRLPVGVLTDRYGGRVVFTALMVLAAVPMWLLSYATSYAGFLWASLGFGVSGASFAVGVAYTSVWFRKERQGTALGIFGAGNMGAAATTFLAPKMLASLSNGGTNLEGWRTLPRLYAGGLLAVAVLFWFLTHTRRVAAGRGATLAQRLAPLKEVRVWRFGLYYFLLFGGFVALAGWLVPYYVNVYTMSVAAAGSWAALFSLPTGVVRAAGGWISDRYGARRVMYAVLWTAIVCFLLLCVPRMEIRSPGEGVLSVRAGTVTEATAERVVVDGVAYPLRPRDPGSQRTVASSDPDVLVLPTSTFWQEPVVKPGDVVGKKDLLARGYTHLYFQANQWIFSGIVLLLGAAMGIGMAAVFRHIPDYFPNSVGVVGGIVGVIGGLGGFVGPILFGSLLQGTGIWTTCWMFFLGLALVCLVWMHVVVQRMLRGRAPALAQRMEDHADASVASPTPARPASAPQPAAPPSPTGAAPFTSSRGAP